MYVDIIFLCPHSLTNKDTSSLQKLQLSDSEMHAWQHGMIATENTCKPILESIIQTFLVQQKLRNLMVSINQIFSLIIVIDITTTTRTLKTPN